MEDKLEIIEIIQNWVLWRDTGSWDRFRTLWHPGAWMGASFFQGPAEQFIERSRAAHAKGVSVLHMLGGSSVDLRAQRAIAQTKMTIHLRAPLDGVLVDVVCMGRFYDFFDKRAERWGLVRRHGVYDKDWLNVVDPSAELTLDPKLLTQFPAAYQHLGYVQTRLGLTVNRNLPHTNGEAMQELSAHGERWLDGSASALPA
jgi:hypothetical protein